MHEELLAEFEPHLRYDSAEAYFADSPAEWTDREFSELRRRRPHGERDDVEKPDEVIASGTPRDGIPKLDLGFLNEGTYGDGKTKVEKTDYVTWARVDHREVYRELHQRPEYRNRIYARAVEGDGRLWLQYWFYYVYNDYNMAGGFGLHEGDWEGIQLRMTEDGTKPDLAVYAQHKFAERRDWDRVRKDDGKHPQVYVACGSHASYFEPGSHQVGAVWFDDTDGERQPPDMKLEFDLNVPDEELPGWARWPGVWGATSPRHPPVEQPSPPGPRRPGERWFEPEKILKDAVEDPHKPTRPRTPVYTPSRSGEWLRLGFDFSSFGDESDAPERLAVAVNRKQPPDDKPREPQRVYSFAVHHVRSGELDLLPPLLPKSSYDISVKATLPSGQPTESVVASIGPSDPGARERAIGTWNGFTRGVAGFFRRVRGR